MHYLHDLLDVQSMIQSSHFYRQSQIMRD
uniref:Uncharacterized protein n=1 Tax=Arundo donax TaxID=35708 RepID=A0A0A9BRJ8_ARUDO